jgi:ABC-type Fe3+/spermidine/putrescine transport system ATPase subunit
MTRLVLDRLVKTFPSQPTPVLASLSLDVRPGELMALLGPSGSGKSTVLKLVAGIEEPDSGDIRCDDQSLLPAPAQRRGTVLMFQQPYLFPFMTVADNIAFGLKVRRAPSRTIKAEVARMLELVELPGIERKYPEHLSGGQQQRVALARALVVEPRVLLLDEPLSSLDSEIRLTLQEVIRRIQRELRITTVLVTHDLGEVMAMADRVALLLDGTIEACERPERLFQRPPTRAAARFMGVSTFLEGRVEGDALCSAYGELKVASSGRARSTTFGIRPEHIRLLDAPAQNTVRGAVRDRVYRGEFSEYVIALGDQIVRAKAPAGSACRQPGDIVFVQFPAEQLFELS